MWMTRKEKRANLNSTETLYSSIEKIFGITKDQIKSRDRHRDIVEARHAFCYVARFEFSHSLKRIGKEINRDHTSIIHSTDAFGMLIQTDCGNIRDKYKQLIEEVCQKY